jgi:hypothetical protein
MNEHKLDKLFEVARKESPPAMPNDFGSRVAREIQREPVVRATALLDQLNRLFPRIAVAALLIIGVCALVEVVSDAPDLADTAADV